MREKRGQVWTSLEEGADNWKKGGLEKVDGDMWRFAQVAAGGNAGRLSNAEGGCGFIGACEGMPVRAVRCF